MNMEHQSGYVNIIGKPNVGKSTLLNAMVGEKLSIITSRAQTTRHRILGILNAPGYQIIFSDTPGLLEPSYKLQEAMLKAARSALVDADVLIYLTEPWEKPDAEDELIRKLGRMKIPLLIAVNKVDLSDQQQVKKNIEAWDSLLPRAEKIPISALKNFNVDFLFSRILHHLPESPPYYPKDTLTDKSERFFAGEMIREKILLHYRQEIPYAVEVEIESFREEDRLIRIHAVIYTERESQKGILIGSEGKALKRVGREARLDMENFFGKKVYLELRVKVKKDWRSDEKLIKKFGYR
ncbi:MAG: GTPase Era [Bacteroidales bacterium]